jgi:16S rRNA processing protein RimM
VRGEVTVVPDTDDPNRFAPGQRLVTDTGRALVVASARRFRDRGLLVAFVGVTDRTEAESLRGVVLTVPERSRRDLEEGEFWPEELVGLRAVTPEGSPLGRVSGVDLGEAQDRLIVTRPDGSEVLVPFVDPIVGDPIAGEIVIDPPGGLF